MMRRYITALMLACCIGGYGQEKKQVTFVPPFDFPLTLSGNFGEIRSNHFHGGLDFKTGGVIGKPVRALADGYISRIRVTNGSGYVLDVCYHNGYSTINRHLSGFVSPIAERVEELAPDDYLIAESITFKVMQMNDNLVVFIWQNGGWQKSSEGYLAMYDERTDTPVPLMKTFPQTGSIL